ncbi:hypothetical protein SAMN05443144_10924 [Fodinibius roseus]|uniref:Uncharacterized protein n=1 Tax=Fodinibius roseus TaxID=1194090 RepID=A0A1M5BY93_9BACT|nr:hypothetical protein [Fodinibius roseus]SHF47307.1 hypothetical protein SAMN05443144_10924 [Fodinibius roseus]
MNKLLEKLPDNQQEKIRAASFPEWKKPMLATLTEDYFDDEGWNEKQILINRMI